MGCIRFRSLKNHVSYFLIHFVSNDGHLFGVELCRFHSWEFGFLGPVADIVEGGVVVDAFFDVFEEFGDAGVFDGSLEFCLGCWVLDEVAFGVECVGDLEGAEADAFGWDVGDEVLVVDGDVEVLADVLGVAGEFVLPGVEDFGLADGVDGIDWVAAVFEEDGSDGGECAAEAVTCEDAWFAVEAGDGLGECEGRGGLVVDGFLIEVVACEAWGVEEAFVGFGESGVEVEAVVFAFADGEVGDPVFGAVGLGAAKGDE